MSSCANCYVSTQVKCSGCDVPYCGTECQADHDEHICAKMSRKQNGKMRYVINEFKRGELHSGSKNGPIVKNPKQAWAIAYAKANKKK